MQTLFSPKSRARVTPREYQDTDHDESYLLWDSGTIGTLTRIFTGGGKTICACLKMDTWLNRGDDYHAMVVSYETQLVGQFAQEIEDVLGINPGIEMASQSVDPVSLPKIIVACRQSLLLIDPATDEQREQFATFGIRDIGPCTKKGSERLLKLLAKGTDPDMVKDHIAELTARPENSEGGWSRLHKFDWRKNWLVVFDEAHRHAYNLKSVRHLVDWFDRNPKSRRCGMTATPKLSSGVSLGHKMFPGVAIDYPLFSRTHPSAVTEGYAVPYIQRYISVEGVDFKSLKKVAGDYTDEELAKVLGEESTLAKLVGPLLDMVEDRKCLIFNPGVQMAADVAMYINARVEAECPGCKEKKWYPRLLVGDGATCKCGTLLCPCDVTKKDEQARTLNGTISDHDRNEVYRGHQSGSFQFLSVCGLCREGYNDPDIACVAVFRPVSKKASSLAEQMKGRACRPLRGLLDGLKTAAERLAAIAGSSKPNALIVDLVGITGLADCASTAQIYADGKPDEVIDRAAEMMAEADGDIDVEQAIKEAEDEIAWEREEIRKEKEEAERKAEAEFQRRAKADAEARYTVHETGCGGPSTPGLASDGQTKFIKRLGMEFLNVDVGVKMAGDIITLLKLRKPAPEVADAAGLTPDQWAPVPLSIGMVKWMNWKKIPLSSAKTWHDYGLIRGAYDNPADARDRLIGYIGKARRGDDLTGCGKDANVVKPFMPTDMYAAVVAAGKKRREELDRGTV